MRSIRFLKLSAILLVFIFIGANATPMPPESYLKHPTGYSSSQVQRPITEISAQDALIANESVNATVRVEDAKTAASNDAVDTTIPESTKEQPDFETAFALIALISLACIMSARK